jgi:hypothetical protein
MDAHNASVNRRLNFFVWLNWFTLNLE